MKISDKPRVENVSIIMVRIEEESGQCDRKGKDNTGGNRIIQK